MKMTAKQLVALHGDSLLGQMVSTEAIGEYPGGPAKVIQIAPDPKGAPEIVYQIENAHWTNDTGGHDIGVFENELAEVLNEHSQPT